MYVTNPTAMETHDSIIDLDNNATTCVDPQVNEAMATCQALGLANPASQHTAGQLARRKLERLRDQICGHLGGRRTSGSADQLIFTSGGTEANNLALHGLAGSPPGRVIVSAVEHPSIQEPADALQQCGFEVIRLGVNASGVVCCQQLAELLTPETPRSTHCCGAGANNRECGLERKACAWQSAWNAPSPSGVTRFMRATSNCR